MDYGGMGLGATSAFMRQAFFIAESIIARPIMPSSRTPLVFLVLFALGFVVLVLGYPGPWTLLIGAAFLLASYGAALLGLRSFGSKGPGETVQKPPLYVSPKSPVDPAKGNIGLEIMKRVEERS